MLLHAAQAADRSLYQKPASAVWFVLNVSHVTGKVFVCVTFTVHDV